MKKGTILNLIIWMVLNIITNDLYAQKEMKFNCNSPAITWDEEPERVPCLELFTITIEDVKSDTISRITLYVFETGGTSRNTLTHNYLNPGKQIETAISGDVAYANAIGNTNGYKAMPKTDNTFSVILPLKLSFRRYYDFLFIIETNNDAAAVKKNHKYLLSATAYALPARNEVSSLQFYGAIGAAMFPESNFKKTSLNLGIATGLKIKIRPISTNKKIGRFGLYPRTSRWSVVLGAVINDLNYKSSEINSAILGIKPVLGLDVEASEHFGITVASVWGKQDTKSILSDNKNTVVGILVGFSFSTAVFQSLKKNLPANSLPDVTGDQD